MARVGSRRAEVVNQYPTTTGVEGIGKKAVEKK